MFVLDGKQCAWWEKSTSGLACTCMCRAACHGGWDLEQRSECVCVCVLLFLKSCGGGEDGKQCGGGKN